MSCKCKKIKINFDEVQRIEAWEDAVNAFRVDLDCDIYITGSNSYLLSSEYSTYLSGRCVEIKMLPLSFCEFIYFHGFEIKESNSALGETRKHLFDKNGERYELREVFDAYFKFGGMPGIADVGFNQEKALILLDGIYSTVVVRDILEREKRRGQQKITDSTLLESYIFYDIKRFDIKGKEFLRTLGKYYIVDIGLRNYLLGFRNRDTGFGRKRSVGKENNREDIK